MGRVLPSARSCLTTTTTTTTSTSVVRMSTHAHRPPNIPRLASLVMTLFQLLSPPAFSSLHFQVILLLHKTVIISFSFSHLHSASSFSLVSYSSSFLALFPLLLPLAPSCLFSSAFTLLSFINFLLIFFPQFFLTSLTHHSSPSFPLLCSVLPFLP